MDPDKLRVEQCKNPWNGKCGRTDIEVYIYYRGRRLPVCNDCWREIADKDFEW
jgi:hypothetical protein